MKKYNLLKVLLILLIVFVGVPVVKKCYLAPDVEKGETVKDFSATLADGTPFRLSDLRGKYVLLDFWGSWCGPCLAEMPEIKNLHEKYGAARFEKASGFVIVSVAIEKDEKRWQRALNRLQMPWRYHILDRATNLRFFDSPIAAQYGVRQVPTKILIDAEGHIIEVDISPREIAAFLEKGRIDY